MNKIKQFFSLENIKAAIAAATVGTVLAANQAFAVLSTEAQALVTGVETEVSTVKEVVWALGPVIIGIIGAVTVVIVAIMIFKKCK